MSQLSRRDLLRAGTVLAIGATWGWILKARATSHATADAYVSARNPDANTGTVPKLLVRDATGPDRQISYLKFAVPATAAAAALRLSGAHGSEWAVRIDVHAVPDNDWGEQAITWRNRPRIHSERLDSRRVGGLSPNSYEWDVTPAVAQARKAGRSTVSLAVVSTGQQTEPVSFTARGRAQEPALRLGSATAEVRTTVRGKQRSANSYRPYLATTVDAVPGFDPDAAQVPVGRFGGRTDIKLPKTGFFYLICDSQSKSGPGWTLVDPDGYPFIAVGLASVAKFSGTHSQDKAAYRDKYGTDDARWASDAMKLMDRLNFNSTGGFSDDRVLRDSGQRIPYTPVLTVMNSFANELGLVRQGYGNSDYLAGSMPVWHPDFPAYASDYLADKMGPNRDDPWLLGWFTDNELPMSTDALHDLLTGTNGGDDPRLSQSREQARAWITGRRGAQVDYDNPQITDAEAGGWLGAVMDRYLRVIKPRFAQIDPNHLLLGSRLHSRALRDREVIAAVGRHSDVLSVNYYQRWEARDLDLDMWQQEAPNSPALFTEFYVKGEDTRFDAEQQDLGSGWIVQTQSDRGTWYQNITISMLRHRHVIGWHDFKFKDNFGDSNKGLLSYEYTEYEEFTEKVLQVNRNAYRLRAQLRNDNPH